MHCAFSCARIYAENVYRRIIPCLNTISHTADGQRCNHGHSHICGRDGGANTIHLARSIRELYRADACYHQMSVSGRRLCTKGMVVVGSVVGHRNQRARDGRFNFSLPTGPPSRH